MTDTVAAPASAATMAIDEIKVREGFNVRRDGGGIEELAGSIELLGVLVPLIVGEDGYLIAGHRRLEAARKAGLTHVPVVPPGAGDEIGAGSAAAENIVRAPLSPAEEAQAIQRMLQSGYSAEGAGKALGLSRQLLGRRMVLLELPEEVRELWGPHGGAQPSAATAVALLLSKAPGLAPHVKKLHQAAEQGDRYKGASVEQLARNPDEWVRKLKVATGTGNEYHKLKGLPKLPKDVELIAKSDHLSGHLTGEQATDYQKLEKQQRELYMWGNHLTLNDADLDAARAAGVTVQFPNSTVEYVVDLAWLRERIKSDVFPRWQKKTVAAIKREAKKRNARKSGDAGELSAAEKQEQEAQRRQKDAEKRWAGLARGANLDLGRALLNDLSAVELTVDIARFFAEASLGGRPATEDRPYAYSQFDAEGRAVSLAAGGLRYVLADWQNEVPDPTKAEPDRTRIEYLNDAEAERRLWEWFDRAKTPGEILGRALVIHAAARWANELVLPRHDRIFYNAERRHVVSSDAGALLEKITRPHVPAHVLELLEEMRTFDAHEALV